jgi:GTP cyclohydrolase IA|tara:strand:- start:2973 stop:3617 length:645 start_codon:yes stop_codon:yes gene_type:complete
MSERVKEFLLPTANSSAPRTKEERERIINKASKAYEAYLDALGFDWRNDPNSDNTPMRVAKAFVNDMAVGCYTKPPKVTSFPSDGYDGIVFQGGIPVKSLCSHHHLPFTGKAHVAYIPSLDGRVIGLSKLNRIVEYYARRPQIQEMFTVQVHNAINDICEKNAGVAVVISAQHTCACLRGVKHDGCEMKTSKLSGSFYDDEKTRAEFYHFVNSM